MTVGDTLREDEVIGDDCLWTVSSDSKPSKESGVQRARGSEQLKRACSSQVPAGGESSIEEEARSNSEAEAQLVLV